MSADQDFPLIDAIHRATGRRVRASGTSDTLQHARECEMEGVYCEWEEDGETNWEIFKASQLDFRVPRFPLMRT